MRVALDTNVLVSAYSARGLSADVFRVILAEHELVLSEAVLAEFERVLVQRFGVPETHVAEFLEELRLHHMESVAGLDSSHLSFIRDPDDRVVLAAALSAEASSIVTGDRDILDVREQVVGIQIFTPREFWESLRVRDK